MNSYSNSYTLLAVLAHPDDESFGMGGTLALYARRGAAVHLVCATRGEAGTVDADFLEGYASIAERRESELRCAAANLGLAGVHFLDYRDSGMPGSLDNQHPQALVAAPLDEVAAKVVHYIRLLKPQVVLTFDPIGGYKHPDHIAIHQATVLAFEHAADPALQDDLPPHRANKLYFNVIPRGLLRLAVKAMPLFGRDPRYFGRNKDIDLAALVEEGNFPIHARINYRSVAEKKDAASLCHASQLGGAGLRRGPMRWAQTLFGQNEYFMRALPPVRNGEKETDLLAGLQLNEVARVAHPS
jgi:N-acetyl-1-D-myo-inositol-2-amino-2-deoxy-alpha-D-glucopyranoside deacetylase